MIEPRVQPLAPFLSFRQMLQQQPACLAPIGIAPGRDPDKTGDLLGLRKIALRGLGERRAVERHDTLVAFAACRLVERDREIALAEQREKRRIDRCLGQSVCIVTNIAAHFATAIVADQQIDDAGLGLRLQRHLPVRILEQRAEQRGQDQRFSQ